MITRCEHCGSKFEVNAELVNSNDPAVRCGECLSLFDARACLYDETEFRKTSAMLKPVQKRKRKQSTTVLDTIDLETADTVAVEHFYTSEGVRNRAESGDDDSAIISAESGSGAGVDADNHRAGRKSIPTGYKNDRISGQNDNRNNSDNRHPGYRPASNYPDDIEFARTAATESSLPDRDYPAPPYNRDPVDHHHTPDKIYTNRHAGRHTEESTRETFKEADSAAVYKKQMMREREQRALQIEPNRDFESQSGAEDLAGHSSVIRDSGFRIEKEMQLQPDTPRFDTTIDGRSHRSSPSVARSNTGSHDNAARGRSDDTQNESKVSEYTNRLEKRDASVADSAHPAHLQPERARYVTQEEHYQRLHEEEYDGPALRDEPYVVPESSAREMRRYQQDRQSLNVKKLDDDSDDAYNDHVFTPEELLVEHEVRARTEKQAHRQSRAGLMFWLLGLVVAICLFLFAARGVIANMNLPEPVITSFCQITGCVPAQSKKDVSQLKTMRQRLYPHPEIENALVISVDVLNSSVYKQPLPTLAVSLLNADNQLVAERDFVSTDYEIVDGSEPGYLMPDEPTRIKIEVIDTGLEASEMDLAFK